METLLRNTSVEMLREYYFDAKGEYTPADFTKEELISVILKAE